MSIRSILLLALLLLVAASCAEFPLAQPNPDGSQATAWSFAFPAWVAAFGMWLWSAVLGVFGVDPSADGQPVGLWNAAVAHWPILTPLAAIASAAFPKVRDGFLAAFAKGTPLLERPQALAAPFVPMAYSPPSVRRQEYRRKSRKAQRTAAAVVASFPSHAPAGAAMSAGATAPAGVSPGPTPPA